MQHEHDVDSCNMDYVDHDDFVSLIIRVLICHLIYLDELHMDMVVLVIDLIIDINFFDNVDFFNYDDTFDADCLVNQYCI